MSEQPANYALAGVPGLLGLTAIAAALIERYDRTAPPQHPVPEDGERVPWFLGGGAAPVAGPDAPTGPPGAAAAGLDEEIASAYLGLIALHRARAALPETPPAGALWHRVRAGRLADLAPLPGFAQGTPC